MSGLSRRQFFPAVAAGCALAQAARAADKPAIDAFDAVARMRCARDQRLRLGYIEGTYYAVVDDVATPLYRVLAGTFARYKPRPDGNLDGASFEVAFFTDWNTGERLDTFLNPLTGKTVKVPITRMGPTKVLVTPAGAAPARAVAPGLKVTNRFLPPRIVGDDVWITEENFVGTAADAKAPFHYNEVTTYHASVAALHDASRTRVPTDVHFSVVVSWRPWLEMGDIKGHLFGDGAGRHIDSIDEFPPHYVAMVKANHPDAIADPEAVLAKVPL